LGVLNDEVRLVQNSALGAVVLHRFVLGFAEGSGTSEPSPLHLLFIVLPAVMLEDTANCILKTRKSSGLRKFVENLSDSKTRSQDLIYSLSARAGQAREYTLASLSIAIAAGLIGLDVETGRVGASSAKLPEIHLKGTNRGLFDAAWRLGYWCAQTPIEDVCEILRLKL
jgi:hypothetical protein